VLLRHMKKFYDAFISLNGRPWDIAKAFAIGVVIGFWPIVGTHTLLAAAAAMIFRMNMTSMFLATWIICNPLTGVPVYLLEYQIGRLLLRMPYATLPSEWASTGILDLGWSVFGPLLAGWLVLSAIVAPLSLPIIRTFIRRVRLKHRIGIENARDNEAAS
jgi:uncharacterized protein